MKTITLDGNKFTSKSQMHSILKSSLNFPDYYGNNLDALWDCITTDISLPMKIIWNNFENSKMFLGDYADKTLQLLLKAEIFLEKELKIEYN